MLISTIPAVISLESHRGLEEDSDTQALQKYWLKKYLLTKDSKEPILEMPEIEMLHKAVTSMLQNTHNVDVLTICRTRFVFLLQDSRQVLKDNLEKMEKVCMSMLVLVNKSLTQTETYP